MEWRSASASAQKDGGGVSGSIGSSGHIRRGVGGRVRIGGDERRRVSVEFAGDDGAGCYWRCRDDRCTVRDWSQELRLRRSANDEHEHQSDLLARKE